MCPIQRVSNTKKNNKKTRLGGQSWKRTKQRETTKQQKKLHGLLADPKVQSSPEQKVFLFSMCWCVFPNLEPPRFPEHSTTCVFRLGFLHLQILQCETCGS